MAGVFFMIEGIDGAGKSTSIAAVKEWAAMKKLSVLDLKAYCEQHNTFPEDYDLTEYDVIFSSEPSYSFAGKAIREELIVEGKKYPPWTIANAFALDREILYRRIIIPALKKDRIVVQERGFASSLVYQPLEEKMQLGDLMRLPGNRLAAENPPSMLLILTAPPDQALTRINSRLSQRFSQFDNLFFQRKVAERYQSQWLRGLFEKLGSQVRYYDTASGTAEANKANALRIFTELVKGDFKPKETQTQL